MVQTTKGAQGSKPRRQGQAAGLAQGQGGEGIGQVVLTGQGQFVRPQQQLLPPGQPGDAPDLPQAEVRRGRATGSRRAEAKPAILPRQPGHGRHPRIIPIQQPHLGPPEQTGLGRRVGLQAGVAIEVIGRDVEDRGHPWPQGPGGLQLKARQLKDIELDGGIEELQGRFAQIAAHGGTQPAGPGHLPHQGGDRALAVGAGDGHHRGLDRPGEELDIPHHLNPAANGRRQAGVAEGDARADDQALGHGQGRGVKVPEEERQVRQFLPHRRQPRGLGTAIGHRHRDALGMQPAGAGEARLAQAQDQGLGLAPGAGRAVGMMEQVVHDAPRIALSGSSGSPARPRPG